MKTTPTRIQIQDLIMRTLCSSLQSPFHFISGIEAPEQLVHAFSNKMSSNIFGRHIRDKGLFRYFQGIANDCMLEKVA